MKFFNKHPKGWRILVQHAQGWRWCYQYADLRPQQGESLADLPVADDIETIVLIAAEQLTLANVTLPSANSQSLRWQLEPLLSEEEENLHIVSLQRHGDAHLMAAINRDPLRQILETLNDHGIVPQRVIPVTLVLEAGTRLQLGDQWLLRLADGTGLSLPGDALAQFPSLSELTAIEGDSLLHLAQGARNCRYSLLQGEFARRPELRSPLFALAGAIMLGWFSVIFPPLWQGWQAQQALTQLNQQLLARYQHYFPAESPTLVRRAFSTKASQSADFPANPGLLALLHNTSSLLEKLHENPLQSLVWDGTTQRLQLTFRDALPAAVSNDAPEGIEVIVMETQLMLSRKS
ncbi:type II secretion system protein GspL [uncultured Pantoea sp.]|uniref:type II secretion system protein GspL n=1 Tax=uncultured Pantoea sp. TaxID=218084 RepID=UPI0025FDFB74|nr:type II secretion system protein GspL [uncultured Pantoea sp.]